MDSDELKGLMPLAWAAKKYKLPQDWLDREARGGRLPCLIADNAVLFDETALLKALHKRARQPQGGNDGPR